MAGKFCFSCGAKIPENCKFCPKCGTSQIKSGVSSAPQQVQPSAPVFSAASAVPTVEPKKDKTKLILIIIGAIIAIALIVLCIVLIVKPGDSSSGGSGKSDKDDDVEAITPYAKLNGESLSNCNATYTYSSQYGTVVFISGYIGNDEVSVGVALDDKLCKSGSTLTDKSANSSSFFDIMISTNGSSYEYTTYENPNVFGSCEFELQSYKEKSEATFTMTVNFTYEGYEYEFEGGATADYKDANQGSQGGNNYNDNYGNGNNYYDDDDYGYGGGYYDDDYGNGATGTRMCGACYGNGICSVCDGTGQTPNWDGNKVTCQSCQGSGSCVACGGTGYY